MSRAVGFLWVLLVVAAMAAPVIQKEEHGATTGFAATGADKMSDMKKSHKVPHSSPERAVGGAAAAASGGVHAAVRIGMLAGNETSNETVAVGISSHFVPDSSAIFSCLGEGRAGDGG
jgi:hypothetical protein